MTRRVLAMGGAREMLTEGRVPCPCFPMLLMMLRTAVLALLLMPPMQAVERPNILLLLADDLGRHASAYRDPAAPSVDDVIKTPVFDQVAGEGIRFDNAFVSSPSCTPSRGALFTGRHFFSNGSASQLHHPWAGGFKDPLDRIAGMPVTLRKAGYHIGWSHKWHLPERLGGGKGSNYERRGKRINGYSSHLSKATDPAAEKEEILREVRGNFRDFLADRTEGQPFFYSFNPTNTHRPWVRGSGRKLWGLDPDALKGLIPPSLPDTAEVREDFADYLGEVMAFDAACGEIIGELRERGELDNTIICITGDHGAPGFPGGKCNVHDFGSRVPLAIRWPGKIRKDVMKTPVSLIDLAPTFLAAAGVGPGYQVHGQNLLPFLTPEGAGRQSRGWALIGREVHVREAREDGLPYPTRALRTRDFLYVINFKPDRWPMGSPKKVGKEGAPTWDELVSNNRVAYADIDGGPTKAWMVEHRNDAEWQDLIRRAWEKRPEEELYDLRNDPGQTVNVAGHEEYEAIHKELRGRLLSELKACQDPRLDNDAFDRPPYHPTAKVRK